MITCPRCNAEVPTNGSVPEHYRLTCPEHEVESVRIVFCDKCHRKNGFGTVPKGFEHLLDGELQKHLLCPSHTFSKELWVQEVPRP